MTRVRALLAAATLASLLAPAAALATAPPGGSSQIYVFDPQSFEGARRGSGLEAMRPHQRVRFDRLLELKKDLVPAIFSSRRDPALK